MSRRTVSVNIWVALEAQGADGAPACRELELDVENELIVEARMVVPRVRYACEAVPLPLLRAMVSERLWAAFETDAVELARRQAEDPDVRFEEHMDERAARAEERAELRRSFA